MSKKNKSVKCAVNGSAAQFLYLLPEKVVSDLERFRPGLVQYIENMNEAFVPVISAIAITLLIIIGVFLDIESVYGPLAIILMVAIPVFLVFSITLVMYYRYCTKVKVFEESLSQQLITCCDLKEAEATLERYCESYSFSKGVVKKYRNICGLADVFLHEEDIISLVLTKKGKATYDLKVLFKNKSVKSYTMHNVQSMYVSKEFIDGFDSYLLLNLDDPGYTICYYET